MPPLNIPEGYQIGVSKIRGLDEENIRAIRDAMDRGMAPAEANDPLRANVSVELATTAVRSVSIVTPSDSKEIAKAIVALYKVKSMRDISVDQFAEYVCDAMETLPDETLRLPSAERSQFRNKLLVLLGSEILALASKIHDLATEDERTFCSARIVTDLRPVFGAVVDEGPKAMVVVHLLKLAYHQTSEKHQQFYVSLDAEDLGTLRSIIDRAESKAKTLRLAVKNIPVLGTSKELK